MLGELELDWDGVEDGVRGCWMVMGLLAARPVRASAAVVIIA